MANVPVVPTEPGIHFVGPERRPTWVEPKYTLRRFDPLRERYNLIRNGIDPDEHEKQQAEKRKRQAAEEGDDEDTEGGNAPPPKRIHKTRSVQRQRRAERAKRPLPVKAHNYTPDYRFYLKGGDVYFVIDRIVFCVHKKKLTEAGGLLRDMLDSDGLYANETIRGRPVIHLNTLGITVRQFRFFLAHLYRTIIIHQILPSGKPLLYFEAALEVLAASVKLDHHEARQEALKGLETLFPTTGVPTPFKPAIAGLRNREEEEKFYRTFPLQALPVLELYRVPAMLPMAYYHAAQLSREDILDGVTVDDTVVKMNQAYAETVLKGHTTLRNARNNTLFKWLHDVVEGELKRGPRKVMEKCADQNMRGDLACFPFLRRMLDQSNKNSYIHGTHSLEGFTDKAKEIIGEHLCFYCLDYVLDLADVCLANSWKELPKCFGLPSWEVLQHEQQLFAEAFAGNYT